MERESREQPLISLFLEKRDVARFGRWVGIFVLISARALAVWEVADSVGPTPLSLLVRLFWLRLVGIGSWGVIIILLAELADRLTGYDYVDEGVENDEEQENEGEGKPAFSYETSQGLRSPGLGSEAVRPLQRDTSVLISLTTLPKRGYRGNVGTIAYLTRAVRERVVLSWRCPPKSGPPSSHSAEIRWFHGPRTAIFRRSG